MKDAFKEINLTINELRLMMYNQIWNLPQESLRTIKLPKAKGDERSSSDFTEFKIKKFR